MHWRSLACCLSLLVVFLRRCLLRYFWCGCFFPSALGQSLLAHLFPCASLAVDSNVLLAVAFIFFWCLAMLRLVGSSFGGVSFWNIVGLRLAMTTTVV